MSTLGLIIMVGAPILAAAIVFFASALRLVDPSEPPELIWRREERVVCPECGKHFTAVVEMYEGEPWPRHVAECPQCDRIILESEWQPAAPQPNP